MDINRYDLKMFLLNIGIFICKELLCFEVINLILDFNIVDVVLI